MRERVADFRVRTGCGYAPAVAVQGARPLADDETCPTLFRYPGPAALLEALARELPPLAPPDATVLWLSDAPRGPASAAVGAFGTLVVLEPLRLSPLVIAGAAGGYVAAPRPVDEAAVVWLPPSRLDAELALWDTIRTAKEAHNVIGDDGDERAVVLEVLGSYLEELAMLGAAGAPPPGRPWIDVPAGERVRLLAAYGVAPRYTV